MTREPKTEKFLSKKAIGVLATFSVVFSGLSIMALPASATTATTPTIIFSGNTLASSLPPTETADRVGDTLAVLTASLARTVSTTRAGYTFGGWSLAVGDAPTTSITTATTADITRTIHAVWNTTLSYNTNFADSGALSSNQTSETYRFGQSLVLPTAGTLVKAGYSFGGWMRSSISTNRITSYAAAALDTGNPILYVAWIKTVSFNGNGGTIGSVPLSLTYIAGGTRISLPVISAMTLRRTGYDFLGWSSTAAGSPVSGSNSYVPLGAQQTLFAVWRVQTTKADARVFFRPGKSGLRASQKLALRDLVDTLRGKTDITLFLVSKRSQASSRALGKARNASVVRYLKSFRVTAKFERRNTVGKANLTVAKKVNRVTVQAGWANPTQ